VKNKFIKLEPQLTNKACQSIIHFLFQNHESEAKMYQNRNVKSMEPKLPGKQMGIYPDTERKPAKASPAGVRFVLAPNTELA